MIPKQRSTVIWHGAWERRARCPGLWVIESARAFAHVPESVASNIRRIHFRGAAPAIARHTTVGHDATALRVAWIRHGRTVLPTRAPGSSAASSPALATLSPARARRGPRLAAAASRSRGASVAHAPAPCRGAARRRLAAVTTRASSPAGRGPGYQRAGRDAGLAEQQLERGVEPAAREQRDRQEQAHLHERFEPGGHDAVNPNRPPPCATSHGSTTRSPLAQSSRTSANVSDPFGSR
jgi:hypothetical protein